MGKAIMSVIEKLDICSNHDVAYTMPAAWYTDPKIFELETERLFLRSWTALCGVSDVRDKQAYITATVAGQELLVVRGSDGVLRGFYNVCPHRGHELLKGCGHTRSSIVCPYHAWSFGLDGMLMRARNSENVEAFDLARSQLSPVRIEEFCGMVYANLDPSAPSMRALAPGLEETVLARRPTANDLIRAKDHRITHVTKANWKAIVDNYLECYHCQPAHQGFVESVDLGAYHHDLHGSWTIQVGKTRPSPSCYGIEPGAGNPEYAGFYLWPTTMLNVTPGEVGMMTINMMFPIDADTTLQLYDFYLPTEQPTAKQMAIIDYYRDVFRAEDISLVESVQRGLKSRGYRGRGRVMVDRQRSGISEHGIAHFHQRVAALIQS
jgi:choline monooxygenase